MTIKGLRNAISVAVDRMRRAKGTIDILYVVEIHRGEYIICTTAHLPQLSQEYKHFRIVKTLKYDIE